MGKTEAKDLLEVTTRDGTRRDGHVSGRPCLGHPSSGQPALPEAVCVPVSIQGLEVLAIVDRSSEVVQPSINQLKNCRVGLEKSVGPNPGYTGMVSNIKGAVPLLSPACSLSWY